MNSPSPVPIEPDGLFDGLDWGSVFRGALLDLFLTLAASIPLLVWLADPTAFGEDGPAANQAIDQALASPEGLFWGAVLGLAATVAGACYGAHRAGAFHVRHGGWIAVLSLLLGLPLYFIPGAEPTTPNPLWFDVFGILAMVPAGLLGGFLAREVARPAA